MIQMTTHQVKVKKYAFKTTSGELRRSFIINLLLDQTKDNYIKQEPTLNMRIFSWSITKIHPIKLKNVIHHDMRSSSFFKQAMCSMLTMSP